MLNFKAPHLPVRSGPMLTPTALKDSYKLEEILGQNQATTWLARRFSDHQRVIIKGLFIRDLATWKDHELFAREIAALKQLAHPGIPAYIEDIRCDQEQTWYLVMTWIEGQNLLQWLTAGNHADESLICTWAEQALEILVYLHHFSPPIVHRDIKPSNLIWDGQRLHLIDFGGVAAALQSQGGSTVTGTYGYMAPEQFAGKAVPASDLYSLGVTLVHLLTGMGPADLLGDSLQLQIPSLSACSGRLRYWLEQMTAYALADRPDSAAQALQSLRSLIAGEVMTLSVQPPPPNTQVHLQHSPQRFELAFHEPFFGIFTFIWVSLGWWVIAPLCFQPVVWALQLSSEIQSLFEMLFFGGWILSMVTLSFWQALFNQHLRWRIMLTLTPEGYSLQRWLLFNQQIAYAAMPQIGSLNAIESVTIALRTHQNRQPDSYLALEWDGQQTRLGQHLSRSEKEWMQAELLAFLYRHVPPAKAKLLQSRLGV
jgi:serine/threonine protein kinase